MSERSRTRNYLSGPYLERIAHIRKDAARLASALANPATLLVPVWRTRNLVARTEAGISAKFLSLGSLTSPDPTELFLLGEFRGELCFAIEMTDPAPPALDGDFQELRALAGSLPDDEAGLLAYARALVIWRERHRFCGRCGSPTASASAGHVRVCTNPECAIEQFPRIDPAIIVLVTDGERALLGRQASWPPRRYSTIAGFVEPGESLEDAVAREVLEETGVQVDRIDYHSSQPWPFPSSLMLGFTAHAATTEIRLADQELEDAQWFTRAQVADGEIALPTSFSISFRLVEQWYDAGSPTPLSQEPRARRW
jgi:NAD+ diphosphatase